MVVLFLGAGIAYAAFSRDLPDPSQPLKGVDQTTKVYDRRGRVIAELFAEQNRTRVSLGELPTHLVDSVVAVEDERYYQHAGVDPLSILRARVVDISTGTAAQGGSTITQQYVVNAFVEREDTIERKVKEAILAYRIERDHGKDEILEMYLNAIYFGHGAYGIETASRTYFGRPASELTLAESALLAGVIKSPGTYSPYIDPEAARGRRDLVLEKMLDQGFISQAEHDQAVAADVLVAGLPEASSAAPYFVEYVKAGLTEEFGYDAVYRGGLEVTTTLDLDLQAAAEQAAASVLDQPEDPAAAIVSLDPRTGEILAMVGGSDFSTQQFNVAVQGRRQPGSAFKPYVLAAAIEDGVLSEQTYDSGPKTLTIPGGQQWTVTGAHGGRSGPMRLREATEKSVNSVFAQVVLDISAERVVETARRMGIESTITPVPAIALGGLELGVSPLEMASAYGTLANGGAHAVPFGVTSVKDASGEVLLATAPHTEPALDAAVAYVVTDMLRGVISRGTGTAAAIGRPAAGKTGTTQEYRDAWFVGFTPELATSVWVGYPEAQREMTSVHGRRVTGGSFPAEIWAAFMRAALADTPASDFTRPEGVTTLKICLDTGQVLTDYCVRTGEGLFVDGTSPGSCQLHTGPKRVTLPNLIGFTKENAIAALKQLELEYSVEEREVDGVPVGIVSDQSPAGGSEITTETAVALIVSAGPPTAAAPEAAFTYTPRAPSVGEPVVFDASTSTDDGNVASYLWEFDDGTEASGRTVTHAFETAGIYDVTLWVTDDEDEADSVTVSVRVR